MSGFCIPSVIWVYVHVVASQVLTMNHNHQSAFINSSIMSDSQIAQGWVVVEAGHPLTNVVCEPHNQPLVSWESLVSKFTMSCVMVSLAMQLVYLHEQPPYTGLASLKFGVVVNTALHPRNIATMQVAAFVVSPYCLGLVWEWALPHEYNLILP